MISSHPAVQFNSRYAKHGNVSFRHEKRLANRKHRHYLTASTRRFINDLESYYSEGFDAPTLSNYELD